MKIFLSLEVPAILEEGVLSILDCPCFWEVFLCHFGAETLDPYLSNTIAIMLCVCVYIHIYI